MSLYPIVDPGVCHRFGIDPLELADLCVRAGVRWLQVRVKERSDRDVLALAEEVVRVARRGHTQVIVNDRADLAKLAGADGVHLGQDDLGVEDVRPFVGPSFLVGVSTHDRGQIDAALAGTAAYVAVGPIFATATKDTGYEPGGLDLVRYASNRGKPVVAIGGITLARAPAVLAAGATGLAVITDLLRDGDPAARVRDYLRVVAA